MAIDGSGIRETARVLRISPTTVITVLKKAPALQHATLAVVPLPCSRATVRVQRGRAAELNDMWS
jgi:insertion element IS1 protein InsB